MELRIELKSWKMIENEDTKTKVIAGTYVVKCGKEDVASKEFNDGYGCTQVPLPAKIMAKAEELDKEIKQAIENFFEK